MESSILEHKPKSPKPAGLYGQTIPAIEDYHVNSSGFSVGESGLIVPERIKNSSFSLLLSGDVSETMFTNLREELMGLDDDEKSLRKLNVDLASFGGEIYYGFAIYDTLTFYGKERNVSITLTSYGPVMSMGALILQAGDVRRMSTNSVMLIHPSSGMMEGNMGCFKAETVQMERLEKIYNQIFIDRANSCGVNSTTNEVFEQLSNANNGAGTYLSAQEAKKYGFVDEVI